MNAAIVRRLSFGSSKRAFPMDKYLSALNNPEYSSELMTAYDSWTEADLEEANKVELKRESLQREVSELEAQYRDLLVKKRFVAALREVTNVESLPRDDEAANAIARNIKQVKEQRKALEKDNKESTGELHKEIARMITQHELVKAHRERLEKQLQEVKGELADHAAQDDRDSTSIFALTDDSINASQGTQGEPPSPFFAVNQVISAYSGVQIGEFGDDRISFHLAVQAANKTHHFTLNVDFAPFNNCAIRQATISPEFPPLEPVFAQALQEDTQFLITETIMRIRNVLELRHEVETLANRIPSIQWQEAEGIIMVARELVSATISIPYDYPTFDAPVVLELRTDGHLSAERKNELNAMKLPTLTALVSAVFRLE